MPVQYVCPTCRSAVRDDGSGYLCSTCDRRYPVQHGIPDFTTHEHYWNQLTPQQMEFLLDTASTRGYSYAVENILGRFADPELARWVLAGNRADFRTVLPLTASTDVVEIGAGWGAVTCGLAPHCRSVTAFDTNRHTLDFIALRTQQDGIGNVSLARINPLDDAQLPLPDGQYDVAVLNGVLEYVGSATREVGPAEAQYRGLREVGRVLKPGGALYIGIENRYGYLYFLGSRDHSGLRYTSLMPRMAASLAMRFRKHQDYRTYTYSYAGYRRLLARAGFGSPRVYIAVPNYRDPRFIVPADDDRAIAYMVRRYASYLRRRSWRWLAQGIFGHTPVSLCGHLARSFSDSFLFVAEHAP